MLFVGTVRCCWHLVMGMASFRYIEVAVGCWGLFCCCVYRRRQSASKPDGTPGVDGDPWRGARCFHLQRGTPITITSAHVRFDFARFPSVAILFSMCSRDFFLNTNPFVCPTLTPERTFVFVAHVLCHRCAFVRGRRTRCWETLRRGVTTTRTDTMTGRAPRNRRPAATVTETPLRNG